MPEKSVNKTKKHNSIKYFFRKRGKFDTTFFIIVTSLLVIGLIMLFSSSAPYASVNYGNSYHFILRQLSFGLIGFALMLLFSRIDYHFWQKLVWPITAVAIVLLVLVLVTPATKEGFHRWLNLGVIQFQPSEVAKFAMIVLLSFLIANNPKKVQEIKYQLVLFGIVGVFCLLVYVENHLSATILLFLIGFIILFISGLSWKLIVGMSVTGVSIVLVTIVTGAISYVADRFTYWLDPWSDQLGKGYQTIQSLLAIASGGALGRGIGQSNQKYWLPEPQNDFIFSVVCEELGFIGAALIIALFGFLVWRGFIIAVRSEDTFGMLLGIGLVFQVGLQAILNVLVVTNVMPNTGISLPFFSYGGTSLIMLLVQMGIVLSISRGSTIKKA